MGNKIIFDLEANAFLDVATRITCLVTYDFSSKEVRQYFKSEEEIKMGLWELQKADEIIGHNIIGADIPFIKKLYPRWTYKKRFDTLIASYLLYPERPRHSLESYSRTSLFSKIPIDDWSCLTVDILDRCTFDVLLNTELYKKMYTSELYTGEWDSSMELEQRVYEVHQEQLRNGILFDQNKALKHLSYLDGRMTYLHDKIVKEAPFHTVKGSTIKTIYKKDGTYYNHIKKFLEE